MRIALATLSLCSTIACSGAGEPPDETSKFVGTWTYAPGSEIAADCSGATSYTIDLSQVPPQNRPGFFTFRANGSASLREVDARGCEYDWSVSGDVATGAAGQTCATFPDGAGGNRIVHLLSGTKTTSDGASMAVDVHFVSDAPQACAIRVHGTATKSATGA
jgi:hypothetical protein